VAIEKKNSSMYAIIIIYEKKHSIIFTLSNASKKRRDMTKVPYNPLELGIAKAITFELPLTSSSVEH